MSMWNCTVTSCGGSGYSPTGAGSQHNKLPPKVVAQVHAGSYLQKKHFKMIKTENIVFLENMDKREISWGLLYRLSVRTDKKQAVMEVGKMDELQS